MGKIVEFASRTMATGQRPAAPGRAQQCEIVIFPGVRYERWECEASAPPPPDPAPVSGKARRGRKG